MDIKNRRGFISTAAGIGAFVAAGEVFAQTRASIAQDDVLLAMPGDRHYAIPKAELERFSVSADVFTAEERRRQTVGPRDRGGPPRTYTALGVRG